MVELKCRNISKTYNSTEHAEPAELEDTNNISLQMNRSLFTAIYYLSFNTFFNFASSSFASCKSLLCWKRN